MLVTQPDTSNQPLGLQSFPIPLKYIDVSRTTCTHLDVMQESRIDDSWNIDGSRDLCNSSTGFTHFTLFKWETSRRIYVVRVRDWQHGKRHPDQIIYGQNSGEECQRTLSCGRRRNGQLKNQSSIMLEDYEWIYFIDPEDKEFKNTIREMPEKMETPLTRAMPCKTCKKSENGETRGKSNDFKFKFACILEIQWIHKNAYGRICSEISWGSYCRKKQTIHYNITIWYTNLFLCLKQWR